MAYPDLYILRHGETVWNRAGRMQGHLNAPLTELGRDQARRQGQVLQGRDLTGFGFWTSPLMRAVETAGLALAEIAVEVRTDDRLREIDVGDWQGRLRAELSPPDPDAPRPGPDGDLSLYARAPGEGLAAVTARARAFLDDLDGPAVVVCHGIVSRMLRCAALGLDTAAWTDLQGGQGNVFHLSRGRMEELR
ncbi:histidine phosphatase family protein [Loktanella sp. M215]|uniref:histidine phosphatase family protein n=1 Tax=Loktanella sp. M215 TaxID=2675431 RepID=UPI001F1F62A7|nr:histidine phosphatase family protein [Loktanella sp. M215]MCF7698874.1 histidine phosphatase family protein [Loktanella sp. M215]